jgi:hypothetical protein
MSNQLQISGAAKIRSIQGPVVANSGVITALDGDASQYVRGDGTLADFPTSTGGGSSVSYYLNTSVSQGTIGGVAYKQLSKVPISGAGTDVTISANGYIASYLTDANDPALLEVPAGNFNCEFYFSVNSNAHNPYVYAEVYKYDGTTFTLLGSSQSVPEYLTNGTTLSPYYFAIPVATSVLTITDRIAIRIYVNVDGRTVTLHTENNHLCQVVTTFSKGLTTLNSLTRQVQFFQTGTSGTDFAISSSVATHTFNLPVASAANTGKLSSTDWSTFNGKVPYTGATADVDLGVYNFKANTLSIPSAGGSNQLTSFANTNSLHSASAGQNNFGFNTSNNIYFGKGLTGGGLGNGGVFIWNNTQVRYYTLPDASGTLALLESTQTFTGTNTFSGSIIADGSVLLKNNVTSYLAGYVNLGGIVTGYGFSVGLPNGGSPLINQLIFNSSAAYNYTFPAATGTLALTSNLSSYVPYTGATANVDLGLNNLTANNVFGETSLNVKVLPSGSVYSTGYATLSSLAGKFTMAQEATAGNLKAFTFDFSAWASNSSYTYTLPAANGTIALTSNLSSYVPYTGATTALNMGNNSITTSNFFYGKGIELDAGVEEVGGTVIFRQRTGISGGGANYTTIGAVNNNVLSFNFWQDSPSGFNRYKIFQFRTDNITISTSRIYQMPDASGTLALTSDLSSYVTLATSQTISGAKTFSLATKQDSGTLLKNGTMSALAGYTAIGGGSLNNGIDIILNGGAYTQSLLFQTAAGYSYTFPAATGTLALGTGTTNYVSKFTGTNTIGNSLIFDNGTNVGIGNTNTSYTLDVSGTLRNTTSAYFGTTSGNIGLGTTTIDTSGGLYTCVTVDSATYSRYSLQSSGVAKGRFQFDATNVSLGSQATGGKLQLFTSAAYNMEFLTNDTLRMTISSSGNVGIGTSSPATALDVNGSIRLSGTGYVGFGGGNNYIEGDNPNNILKFGTNNVERMRITSGGGVCMNTTTQINSGILSIAADVAVAQGITIRSTGANSIYFIYMTNSSGGAAGTIAQTSATTVNYGSGSDYRLKEDLQEFNGLDKVSAIKVYDFKWKDEDRRDYGSMAHELQQVVPNAVVGEKDEMNQDGTIRTQQVDYSKLVPVLVKAIQELSKQNEELSNRLIKLESK